MADTTHPEVAGDPVSESDLRARIAADILAEREVMRARAQTPEEEAWAAHFYQRAADVARTGQRWQGPDAPAPSQDPFPGH